MAAVVSLGVRQPNANAHPAVILYKSYRRAPIFGVQESKFWARWEKLEVGWRFEERHRKT